MRKVKKKAKRIKRKAARKVKKAYAGYRKRKAAKKKKKNAKRKVKHSNKKSTGKAKKKRKSLKSKWRSFKKKTSKQLSKAKTALTKIRSATSKLKNDPKGVTGKVLRSSIKRSDWFLQGPCAGSLKKFASRYSTVLSYAQDFTSFYENLDSGKSFEDSLSEAYVDTMFTTAGVAVSTLASVATVALLSSGPAGWVALAGCVVGIAAGVGFSLFVSTRCWSSKKSIKEKMYCYMMR